MKKGELAKLAGVPPYFISRVFKKPVADISAEKLRQVFRVFTLAEQAEMLAAYLEDSMFGAARNTLKIVILCDKLEMVEQTGPPESSAADKALEELAGLIARDSLAQEVVISLAAVIRTAQLRWGISKE